MIVVDNNKVFSMFDVSLDASSSYATADINSAVQELARVKRQMKLLQDNADSIAATIKKFMDDKDSLIGIDGTVIATNKLCAGAVRVDANKLKNKYLEAYTSCLVQSKDYRRLDIK